MVAGYRKPALEPSPATKLVRDLLQFGQPQQPPTHLDGERAEVGVSRGKGKGKANDQAGSNGDASATSDADDVTARLDKLSVKNGAEGKGETSKALKKLLRSANHTVTIPGPGGREEKRILTSWKMADYAYKREPCPFPTRARGLFTEKVSGGEGEEYRIVARGYDKFFNVNEVSWTKWDAIPQYSTGPYELTTKSNGCIILIAALTPSNLVVTSKHSVGRNANLGTEGGVSHSERGEYWLEQHVKKVGRTKEDLAKELFEMNLTAVAELCDDSFEEHVLPYPPEATGLHLHGLNHNSPTLNTLSSSEVASFARKFGLIPTPYTVFPSVVAVRTYCETVEKAGGVEGPDGKLMPVEGFVVRGHRKGGSAGEAFFWKVKYDEPYLMYREWRELTRKLLASYPNLDSVSGNKIRNEESRLYLWWVRREIQRDRARFDPWKHGKGIIKTREEFLAWQKTPEANQARRELGQKIEMDEEERKSRRFDRTIIVPVAVQGCGKTALGLELAHLFGWGHVQSDDFLQKKPAPHFLKAVKGALDSKEVVIADKNNHLAKHREDLVSLAESVSPKHTVRLVALVWPTNSPSLPRDKFHALCASRIVKRGQNHQTLRAGELHESVLWQFLGQHEPFDQEMNAADSKFDHVIEMRAEWTQDEALRHAIEGLAKIEGVLPKGTQVPLPNNKIEEAVKYAGSWTTSIRKEESAQQVKQRAKAGAARYYGIAVEVDVKALVEKHIPQSDKDDKNSLWSTLVKSSRVERKPHLTLVHRNELESTDEAVRMSKQALWDCYAELVDAATKSGKEQESLAVELTLGPRLVWDGRAMSLEISALTPKVAPKKGEKPHISLVDGRAAHITVGTRSSDIRPVEGKFLMEIVAKGGKSTEHGGAIHQVRIGEVKVPGKLAGLS
ncbi:tRNA ligase [Rhodotorula toruloides]|uniref:tRNA ligase n=1 Tax=Rhodotorula toruloides TaxID=5286 RepID=A0A511KKB3_RHOTO|nr:tRNA ligase [Rhodotorula toruloides]